MLGPEWKHYLWIQDRDLLPRTVIWAQEHGFVVKEFRELPPDPIVTERFNLHVSQGNLGIAIDILKAFTVYHYGGMALDLDILISAWSNLLLYSFDAVFTRELYIVFDEAMFNNDLFLAKAGHPVFHRYLQLFKSQFSNDRVHIQQSKCMQQTAARTPFEAGVYPLMVAWALEANRHGTRDIALYPKNTKTPTVYHIRTSDTEHYEALV